VSDGRGSHSGNGLREYWRIAGAYEKVRRRDNLSWSHHQEVAAREDRGEWLGRRELAHGAQMTFDRVVLV
jgi:hypothetical protein